MLKHQRFDYYNNQTSDMYSEEYRGYTIRRDRNPEHVFYVLYKDGKRITDVSVLSGRYTNPQYLKNRIDIHLGIDKIQEPEVKKNEVSIDNKWIIFKSGLGLWRVRCKEENVITPEQLLGQYSDGQYALDAIREYEKNYEHTGNPVQGRNNAKHTSSDQA